jgi:hypothetical protein
MKISLSSIRTNRDAINFWSTQLLRYGLFCLVLSEVFLSANAADWRYSVRYAAAPLIAAEQLSQEKETAQALNHGVDAHVLYFYRPGQAFSAGMNMMVDIGLAISNQWGAKFGHRKYFMGTGASDVNSNQEVVISSQNKWGFYWGVEFRFIEYSVSKDQFDEFAGFFEEDVETSSFAAGGNIGADYHISQERAWNLELGLNLAQFGNSAADKLKMTTPFYLLFGISQKF